MSITTKSESQPHRSRFLFWGCTIGMLIVSSWMALLSDIGTSVYLFSVLYVFEFILLFVIIKHFPFEWNAKKQITFIILLSFVAHLVFLAFPASEDVNRYVWESYLLNQGINPFFHAPDDPILTSFIEDMPDIWQEINHKDATACYPPLSMLIFRLAAYISPTKIFFNVIIILFNLAAIGILILLVRAYQLPLNRVFLYALNPLVLVFIAGEGHVDSIQIFFVCVCLYFFKRKKEHWGFLALGCAIMSKYFSAILVPFLINAKNWKKTGFLFVPIVLLYLPFRETGWRLFSSLIPFGTVMHYNDSLTVLLRKMFGSQATFVSVLLLSFCFAMVYILVHDPLKSAYLAVGCLLLLIATLHPWYLTLVTLFLVFFPSRAWLYLHIAVVFTFPVLHVAYHTGMFQEIHWVKWFEYLPFYALLIGDTFKKTHILPVRHFAPVRSISLIIPTLNESANIRQCLASIEKNRTVSEIIVVDGGSTDDTQEIAYQMGAHIVQAPKGRGYQIHAGVSKASGDVILILHADCLLDADILPQILHKLNEYPYYIGGSVGMAYLTQTFTKRLIARLNNSRARWTGIAFGDQAQFFRRKVLPLIGGYPEMMLMEDVELSLRLKEHGPLCFLPGGVLVSTRRWERIGTLYNIRHVVWSCLNYLVQRRLGIGDPQRRDFYNRYYSTKDA